MGGKPDGGCIMRLVLAMMLISCGLTACGGDVRYVEATPAPEVTAAPLEGDDQ